MIQKVVAGIKKAKSRITGVKVNIYAAGTAFFLFLSLVPILVLTVTLLPYTGKDFSALSVRIQELFPAPVGTLFVALMRDAYEKSVEKVSLAILMTLWSAGKGMYFLTKGLNEVYGVKENKNYFSQRILASFYTLTILLMLLFSLSAGVFHLPFLFPFLVQTFVIAGIYCIVPNRKGAFFLQIPGAVLSSVGWQVYSFLFTAYLRFGNAFGSYGSISLIVIFMLWLYFDLYILFSGAIFNDFLEKRTNKASLTLTFFQNSVK